VAKLERTVDDGAAARRVKRVVITGSESTGKSTLAEQLADHYGTEWVPEFVRDYAESKGTPLDFSDHGPIARGQIEREDEFIARALNSGATLLFQDTDLLSTAVYCAHYYESCPGWIDEAARARRPDLYLLLDIDIPWIPDPQRDRGHLRKEMHALFVDAVQRSGSPFALIAGSGETRFSAAVAAVDDLLTHHASAT
jgi:NadR type nicotinamide-nucleotide adenylyltransferase